MWFFHLLFLLVIYSFGPGLLLVRPLRLAPRERLVVAVGVGLFLNYVLGFVIFANDLPLITHTGVTAVSLALGIFAYRDWLALLRSRQVRQLLLCWVLLLVWGIVLLSMIRNFGGGTWGGDWVEHYQRTLFFFGGEEYSFKFIDQYALPMRPPMMNVLTASLLAQTVTLEQTMEAYQVVFVFLNSLVYLPLAILVPRLVKLPPRLVRKTPWTLAAFLAASPMFDQNLTYTWTKLFAAFYALAGMAVYLRAWRRSVPSSGTPLVPSSGTPGEGEGGGFVERRTINESPPNEEKQDGRTGASKAARSNPLPNPPPAYRRRGPEAYWRGGHRSAFLGFPLAFALLCIGFLVHFSVGPYGLFLGLHYLAAVWWRRPNKLAEAGLIAAVSLAVFAAWFPWSVSHYGARTTFTSTSAVSDSAKMTPTENVANIARNTVNTLVPTIVQKPWLVWSDDVSKRDVDLDQPSFAGRLRDYTFLIYQVSLPGGLGSAGCVLAVYLLWRAMTRRDAVHPSVRRFWLAFIPIVFVAGVAVYGGVDRFGVAHICLQPMILCGIALLAGGVWVITLRLRAILLVGLLADFGLGVMLQMTLQHQIPPIEPVAITLPDGRPGVGFDVPLTPDTPSRAAQNNAGDKLRLSVNAPLEFWGDRFRDGGLPALQLTSGAMLAFFLFMGFAGKPQPARLTQAQGFPIVPAKKPRRKHLRR